MNKDKEITKKYYYFAYDIVSKYIDKMDSFSGFIAYDLKVIYKKIADYSDVFDRPPLRFRWRTTEK